MKNYDKIKEPSYLGTVTYFYINEQCYKKYLEMISSVLKQHENFIKTVNEDSNVEHFIETDDQYPKKMHKRRQDLCVSPKRMKIEITENFVGNLHHKE